MDIRAVVSAARRIEAARGARWACTVPPVGPLAPGPALTRARCRDSGHRLLRHRRRGSCQVRMVPVRLRRCALAGREAASGHACVLAPLRGGHWRKPVTRRTAGNVLSELRRLGKKVLFITNNSSKSRATYAKRFARLGIEVAEAELFPSVSHGPEPRPRARRRPRSRAPAPWPGSEQAFGRAVCAVPAADAPRARSPTARPATCNAISPTSARPLLLETPGCRRSWSWRASRPCPTRAARTAWSR